MTPDVAAKIDFTPRSTNVGAQKIDSSLLGTYGMVSAEFLLQDSLERVRFFKETFLLVDTNIEVVLGMPFLSLSNADFQSSSREFNWRSYIIAEALPITRQIEVIDKDKFARTVLDQNSEMFVVHLAALNNLELAMHPSRASLPVTL